VTHPNRIEVNRMRRYGLYDTTRGLTTAVAAGVAGLLLWVATLVGTQSGGRFWAAMAIVAGAGLVLSLSQVVGAWTKGLRLRLSPGTLTLAFLPVLVCVVWILLASQPGSGWQEGRIVSWSASLGLLGIVHDLALWHGALALGLGLVLGFSFDGVPEPAGDAAPIRETVVPVAVPTPPDEPVVAELDEERRRTLTR
jgi:hypothetical protein